MSILDVSNKLSSVPPLCIDEQQSWSVNSSALSTLFQAAKTLGADIGKLIDDVGIEPADLLDSDQRFPVADLLRLYDSVA
ncbi:MAG: hypothetical protein KKF24_07790, partial [Gammaproteobacteria bacterium]|nr:hypothetical protein [Gammaproteobacteria bacterium]MBU1832583.1 hypothetical protein [Gammaproteobacteria bacterium]